MRFFLYSLGCKVNSYENDLLRAHFLAEGHRECDMASGADVVVINTCSVTATSDQKSRQHIRRFRKEAPEAILVVMGCYSQHSYLEAKSLGANIVLGTAYRKEIPSLIEEFQRKREPIVKIDPKNRRWIYEDFASFASPDNARAYLKIQDGCSNFCSYCLIPFVRGNSRSRGKESILQEAKALVAKGYKEIVITGIEIGFYGLDLGDGKYRLADLLKDILDENPSLPRLRISSLNASEIDDRLIELFKGHPALCSHLHLSLQSGSDKILRLMKRPYGTEEFYEKLVAIRKARPEIAITTDVIAGFCEESEKDWEQTISFCKKCAFAEIHVFPYSPRKGTYAYSSLLDTPSIVKKRRSAMLLALSKELRKEYERRFFGQKIDILFEDYDERSHLSYGHSSNFLLVKLPSESSLRGQIINLEYNEEAMAD